MHYALSSPWGAQPVFQKHHQSRNQPRHSSLSSHSGCLQPPCSIHNCVLCSCFLQAILGNEHTSAWLTSSQGVTISPPRASSMPTDTFIADFGTQAQRQAGFAAKRAVSPVSAVTPDCWTNVPHLTESCLLICCSLQPSLLLTKDFAASQPASF